MRGALLLTHPGASILDCILPDVHDGSMHPGAKIEYCNVYGGKNSPGAKPGKGCFTADPQFRDPKNLDYRLKRTSPCRGRASDGGDIGCRFTPEMIELLRRALVLRKRGILKF